MDTRSIVNPSSMNSVSKKYRTGAPYGTPMVGLVRIVLMLIAGVLLTAGCGADSGDLGQATGSDTTAPTTETTSAGATSTSQPPSLAPGLTSPAKSLLPPPPAPGGPQIEVPAVLMDQIRADAAQRAGVAPANVLVVLAT